MKKPVKTKKKEPSSNKAKAHSGVFNEIKKEGAKPVSDKKLDQKQGEGLLGGLAATVGGAIAGGIGGGVGYVVAHAISGNSMSWRGAAAAIGGGAAATATAAAIAYVLPTP